MPTKASKSDQKSRQTNSTKGSATGPSNDAYDDYDPTERRPKDLSFSASGQKRTQSGSGETQKKKPTEPFRKDAYDDYDPSGK